MYCLLIFLNRGYKPPAGSKPAPKMGPKDLQTPDLWIGHGHMEMKTMDEEEIPGERTRLRSTSSPDGSMSKLCMEDDDRSNRSVYFCICCDKFIIFHRKSIWVH